MVEKLLKLVFVKASYCDLRNLYWFYILTYIFFLASQDEEDNVYKRDFAKPTLEDHFDKTVIPKVMQVSACNSVKQHTYILYISLLFLRRL